MGMLSLVVCYAMEVQGKYWQDGKDSLPQAALHPGQMS